MYYFDLKNITNVIGTYRYAEFLYAGTINSYKLNVNEDISSLYNHSVFVSRDIIQSLDLSTVTSFNGVDLSLNSISLDETGTHQLRMMSGGSFGDLYGLSEWDQITNKIDITMLLNSSTYFWTQNRDATGRIIRSNDLLTITNGYSQSNQNYGLRPIVELDANESIKVMTFDTEEVGSFKGISAKSINVVSSNVISLPNSDDLIINNYDSKKDRLLWCTVENKCYKEGASLTGIDDNTVFKAKIEVAPSIPDTSNKQANTTYLFIAVLSLICSLVLSNGYIKQKR